MQRFRCFMVRHQAEGTITSSVFPKPATEEQVAAVLEACDLETRHGKAHPKTEEPYWIAAHEAVLIVSDEQGKALTAAGFELAPPPAPKREPGNGTVGISSPKVMGSGVVTNPADQTPEQAKAAAETRARRAAERGRDVETITPADVATVNASDFAKK